LDKPRQWGFIYKNNMPDEPIYLKSKRMALPFEAEKIPDPAPEVDLTKCKDETYELKDSDECKIELLAATKQPIKLAFCRDSEYVHYNTEKCVI